MLEDRARHYPFSYDPEECPTSHDRSSGTIPTPTARSNAGCAFLCMSDVRPRPGNGLLIGLLTYAIKGAASYQRRLAGENADPAGDARLRSWILPRFFATLMMEAARALGLLLPVSSPDISMCRIATPLSDIWAAARRMRGAKSICPAPVGWNSDPTNGSVGNRTFIRVAVARDARRQAVPLHGFYYGDKADEEGMVRLGQGSKPWRQRDSGRRQMLIEAGFDITFRVPGADADVVATEHPSLARRRSAVARRHLFDPITLWRAISITTAIASRASKCPPAW